MAVPHLCGFYSAIYFTTKEKARKNFSQCSRSVPADTMKTNKHSIRVFRNNNKKFINFIIKQE